MFPPIPPFQQMFLPLPPPLTNVSALPSPLTRFHDFLCRTEGSTIEEPETVDLLKDVKDMRQAMSGWGTNENTLINILTHRTYNNRLVSHKY